MGSRDGASWARRMRSRSILGTLLALVLPVGAVLPAEATFPGDEGSIMYARWGPDFRNYGFYTIEPDGSHVDPVDIRGMEDASWSPDGTRFAYAAYVASGPKVFVFDTATQERTRVVTADDFPVPIEYIANVAFGPTGDRLVLGVHANEGAFLQLFTVGVDGSDLTQISGDRELTAPDWSSTDRIVAHTPTSRTKLFTLDPDGGNVELLVRLAPSRNRRLLVSGGPTWAPDGSAVAFTSNSGRYRSDIWIVDADGSNVRRATDSKLRWEWSVVWSPDGASLVVSRGGRSDADTTDLWLVHIAGGRERLTDTPRLEEFVRTWQAV
jgi:Tol biopolymer transport system component